MIDKTFLRDAILYTKKIGLTVQNLALVICCYFWGSVMFANIVYQVVCFYSKSYLRSYVYCGFKSRVY